MKKINIVVSHSIQKYSVTIGDDLLMQFTSIVELKKYSLIYIITDSNVAKHYLPVMQTLLNRDINDKKVFIYIFEAGEKNKKLQVVEQILIDMAEKKLDRKSVVINLGGGVVTDLGGFAASVYQRGVDFINIPTTLEGMVDASVGGKTGVNLGYLKNYIGTFRQPKAVIIDVKTLRSLPGRVLLQGYAEVMKHGLIADKRHFELSSEKSPLEMTTDELIEIIARSVEIKAQIIQEDEKESGIRKVLNFGHTVGHIIESMSLETDNPLFHGEAVSIGMIAEAKISERLGMINEREFSIIECAIKKIGLPTHFDHSISVNKIIEMLVTDKKNIGGKVKWTLLSAIGSADFNIEIGEKFMHEGVRYVCN